MKKQTPIIIILMVIILTGIQVQMFVLRKATLENRNTLIETVQVMEKVVDHLKGF